MAEQDIDVDALLADINAPKPGISDAGPEAPAAPPEPPAWNGEEWKIKSASGEVVPDSREKLLLWAGQGHTFSQRMAELNRTHSRRMADLEKTESKYKGYDNYVKVDEYARQNPQWWQFVEQNWNNRSSWNANPQQPGQQAPIDPQLLERLSTTESALNKIQERYALEEQGRHDKLLTDEIEAIRKQYPTIDFNSIDESGESLEFRILKHANDNNIPSFKVSARDYLHDKLIELAKADSKEAINKQTQQQVKKGVLGTTPVPTKGLKTADKRISWNDPRMSAESILRDLQNGG